MINLKNHSVFKKIPRKFLISSLAIGSFLSVGLTNNLSSLAFDIQWDPDPNWVKLKYHQTSTKRMDSATYYLFLRPRNRKAGILKLNIKVPDYFDAQLTTKKINLCEVLVGGYTDRTKCIKDIPAAIEINEDQTSIDIYPEQPIPVNKNSYAVVMKIFNPRKAGMFQFHAYAQSPGAVPVAGYVGTWNFEVDFD